MYYANCRQMSEEIINLVTHAQPPLRWFCIDASAVDDVDYSAAETLRSLFSTLREKGIRLVVAQVLDDVREQSRYDLLKLFGEDALYDTLDQVITAYQQQWDGKGR
jgi:MFS superfamily sulfate permease-like transporter